jgi:hypothetical protein
LPVGTVKEYQDRLKDSLSICFKDVCVRTEWRSLDGERGVYSPRLDLAVGPFAEDRNRIAEYNHLSHRHDELLRGLHCQHCINLSSSNPAQALPGFDLVKERNKNARCFMAIEIENRVSNKHLMGGAINAAALGRFGLAVAWNDWNLTQFIRMRDYLLFLSSVGKNSFDPANLLILTADQFEDIVSRHAERSQPEI